jgi:hypothetical protein
MMSLETPSESEKYYENYKRGRARGGGGSRGGSATTSQRMRGTCSERQAARGSDTTRGRGREENGKRWWCNKTQTEQPTREQEGNIERLAQQEAKVLATVGGCTTRGSCRMRGNSMTRGGGADEREAACTRKHE